MNEKTGDPMEDGEEWPTPDDLGNKTKEIRVECSLVGFVSKEFSKNSADLGAISKIQDKRFTVPVYKEMPQTADKCTKDQANAWLAVADLLTEVAPGWTQEKGTGLENAIAAIRKLVGKWEYYYRESECKALSSSSSDCICWHAEGTGPFAEAKHNVQGNVRGPLGYSLYIKLEWRKQRETK